MSRLPKHHCFPLERMISFSPSPQKIGGHVGPKLGASAAPVVVGASVAQLWVAAGSGDDVLGCSSKNLSAPDSS